MCFDWDDVGVGVRSGQVLYGCEGWLLTEPPSGLIPKWSDASVNLRNRGHSSQHFFNVTTSPQFLTNDVLLLRIFIIVIQRISFLLQVHFESSKAI